MSVDHKAAGTGDGETAGTGNNVGARARAAAREAGGTGEVKARADDIFQETTERLLRRAEEMRMQHMQHYHFRNNVAMAIGIIATLTGGVAFGWFFLISTHPGLAFMSLIAPLLLYYCLHSWSREPLKNYAKHHKQVFMPEMAKALGNMRFNPRRGISEKVIRKAGIVPDYGRYRAEDCFLGEYKGARMILCEARLSAKRPREADVFDGIFVFIEAPQAGFSGHTVITADSGIAGRYGENNDQYEEVDITISPYDRMFYAYSTVPETANGILSEAFLKEFREMAELFDDAGLSAAFFGGKYLFIAIPYDKDMFEPSNVMLPVTTRDHALVCKREIEQLISIVDILELYDTKQTDTHAASYQSL